MPGEGIVGVGRMRFEIAPKPGRLWACGGEELKYGQSQGDCGRMAGEV